MVATFNVDPEFRKWVEQNPIRPGRQSGTGRAALERRTIYILDVFADPEYSYGAKNIEAYRTILAVPMLKGNDLLGVIMIYRWEVKPFTDKQIALLETFADQAAIAIENVRLLDGLRERTDDLGRLVGESARLGEVSEAVNSTSRQARASWRSDSRFSAGVPRNPRRMPAKNAPSTRNSCASPSRNAMRARSGKTRVVTASATTMPSRTSTTRTNATDRRAGPAPASQW